METKELDKLMPKPSAWKNLSPCHEYQLILCKKRDPSSAKRIAQRIKSLKCNNAHNWTSSCSFPSLTLFYTIFPITHSTGITEENVDSFYPHPKLFFCSPFIQVHICYTVIWNTIKIVASQGDEEKLLLGRVKMWALHLHLCINA